jgi:tetratricopeptide (TPR) repeat protein
MSKPDFEFPLNRAVAELRRAEQLVRAGQWSRADECFSSAVEVDHSPASRIAFGSSLAGRERYNEAICQLTGALDLASASGDREALGVIFHNLAAIYRDLGDGGLASRFQQRAILQLDDCGQPELLGLANDAWLSGRSELAASLAASCEDLDEDIGSESLSAEAHATLAVISGMSGDPREGIRSLIRVYRTHRSASDERLMGIDLLNLAVLFSETGWHGAEMRAVQQAVHHFENAPAPVSAARARRILATLKRVQSLRDFDHSMN